MSSTDPLHPSMEELRAFSQGRTDQDQEVLCAHLDQCERCREQLDQLQSEDPLIAQLQQVNQPATDLEETAEDRRRAVRALVKGISPDPAMTGTPVPDLRTPADHAQGSSSGTESVPLPRMIQDYEIFEEVGRGGMGVVYRARHLTLNRLVALKMLLRGDFASVEETVRFRLEAEVTARMQHPNIVQVHEVGSYQGRPFLALEWVEGGTLAARMEACSLSPLMACRLTETLARAVEVAHRQGVLHRDLKPANVLIAETSEDPKEWMSTVKIVDFGLAKPSEGSSSLTETGIAVGTPEYVAPEQALGEKQHVGARADIFALGVIFYELLSGNPPFRGATPLETLQQVIHQEPLAPRRVNPEIPRDLEVICLKCLSKEPLRRYESAQDLAEDLRRYRNDEPIHARPVGRGERVVKWAKRRPALAGLWLMIVIAVLGGASAGFWFTKRLQKETNLAQAQKGIAEHREEQERKAKQTAESLSRQLQRELEEKSHRLMTTQLLRVALIQKDDPQQALSLLLDREACPPQLRDFAWGFYYQLCRETGRTFRDSPQVVTCVAFSPAGTLLVSGTGDDVQRQGQSRGEIWIREVQSGKVLHTLQGHSQPVSCLALSPDGKLLASGTSKLGQGIPWDPTPGELKIWDVETGKELFALQGHVGPTTAVAFSPDGQTLASATGYRMQGEVKLWNPKTGKEIKAIAEPNGPIMSLAYSPDGQRLALGLRGKPRGGTIRLLHPATGNVQTIPKAHLLPVMGLAFSPKGDVLASSSGEPVVVGLNGEVKLWDLRTGRAIRSLKGDLGATPGLAFNPTGEILAVGGGQVRGKGVVSAWDAHTGARLVTLEGHSSIVWSLAFRKDGKTLATGSQDSTVRLWPIQSDAARFTWKDHQKSIDSIAISPDGQTVATTGGDNRIVLRDVSTGKHLHTLVCNHPGKMRFSPDGKTLAWGTHEGPVTPKGEVRFFDLHSRKERPGALTGMKGHISAMVWLRGGTVLAVATTLEKNIRLFDVASKEVIARLSTGLSSLNALAVTPDDRTLVSVHGRTRPGTALVWDLPSQKRTDTITVLETGFHDVAFSPDGQRLALLGKNGHVTVRSLKGDPDLWKLETPDYPARCLAFTPDGRNLITAGGKVNQPGRTFVWDRHTRQKRATLEGHRFPVWHLTITPDSRTLITGTVTSRAQGEVKVWIADFPAPENAPP